MWIGCCKMIKCRPKTNDLIKCVGWRHYWIVSKVDKYSFYICLGSASYNYSTNIKITSIIKPTSPRYNQMKIWAK